MKSVEKTSTNVLFLLCDWVYYPIPLIAEKVIFGIDIEDATVTW